MRPITRYFYAGIRAVLTVGIAFFYVLLTRRGKAKEEAPYSRGTGGLTEEKLSFVKEQVNRYRDEMVRYEIGLERHRRNTSREVLMKVLGQRGEVTSMPILYLNTEEWVWDQSQLRKAVEVALNDLGLSVSGDHSEPTAQAAQACEDWAAKEAKRQFDKFLGTDA